MVNRAFFGGRFQPFHRGHLAVVLDALRSYDEVVIGVCGTSTDFTAQNPFTIGERLEVIAASVQEDTRSRVWILPVTDCPENSLWASRVLSSVPSFSCALTNNPLQALLMRRAGVDVLPIPYVERQELSGTYVRKCLRERDQSWRSLVAGTAINLLESLGAEERLASVSLREESDVS